MAPGPATASNRERGESARLVPRARASPRARRRRIRAARVHLFRPRARRSGASLHRRRDRPAREDVVPRMGAVRADASSAAACKHGHQLPERHQHDVEQQHPAARRRAVPGDSAVRSGCRLQRQHVRRGRRVGVVWLLGDQACGGSHRGQCRRRSALRLLALHDGPVTGPPHVAGDGVSADRPGVVP